MGHTAGVTEMMFAFKESVSQLDVTCTLTLGLFWTNVEFAEGMDLRASVCPEAF